MNASKQPRDLYAEVTHRIVNAIERGVRPWCRPWTSGQAAAGMMPRRHTGEAYRGVNVLLLWAAAQERGYTAHTWMTFRQAQAEGGQVRKGEKGTTVVFAGQFPPAVGANEESDEDAPTRQGRAYLRCYTVFNVEQVDGLQSSPEPQQVEAPKVDAAAQAFIARTGATVHHGGDRAFYAPGPDLVQLPHARQFRDVAAYLGTVTHELVHWTGHPGRLARQFGQRFGDRAYAVEELVAELGAAFVCARLNVSAEPRDDHAAYLAEWLAVLKADKRALFTAAAHAQRAADYLHELQGEAAMA
ncbi:zincin-like metallopeptidase domain-containing protein [Kinneretia asaccharophila]|uniref:Antirestriction protein ArdC n=1 Tax=Roseateles asaccharophilus TaxID=582607 RepID=A0A4R6N7H6_9BURK|nr:zincin-like metallopeptidase domain-containing protein [Roseateles asaccharophilus]MDN3544036.1 zincin-like metallopeptidase domain-containing protein [Roseateles asaccharophilus]TDP09369.1 antirestriction protein ArdC [Roseateles asaccharophilus]